MGFTFEMTVNTDAVKSASEKAIERGLTAVGLFLASEAADELENDPRRVDTGRLKNSITSQYEGAEQAVYVGTNVDYAIYVHEGTRRMTPNRFLKNAFERNEDQVKQYIEEALKNG
jgi:HK97 gp10 family phage protein